MGTKYLSSRCIGAIALVTGTVSFSLVVLPYYPSSNWYIPKSSPVWGYRSPATLEGWIILAAAYLLFAVTINVLFSYAMKRLDKGKGPIKQLFTPLAIILALVGFD